METQTLIRLRRYYLMHCNYNRSSINKNSFFCTSRFFQTVQLKNGICVPNFYLMCYNILDFAKKGNVCEHDLFQLIQELRTEELSTQNLDLSINYADSLPRLKNSLFINTMAADFVNMISNLQTLIESNSYHGRAASRRKGRDSPSSGTKPDQVDNIDAMLGTLKIDLKYPTNDIIVLA